MSKIISLSAMAGYLLFLILIIFNTGSSKASDELERMKPRRGGTVGLFAFPRVGRSFPNWYTGRDYNDYDDIKYAVKRQRMVAFPRVGKIDPQLQKWSSMEMPSNPEGGDSLHSGLWFGPRLGRIQKRNFDNQKKSTDQY